LDITFSLSHIRFVVQKTMLATRVYRIHELHEAWENLSQGRPFCSPQWMGSWLRELRGNCNPFVVAVVDCEQVVAIAPLHRHTSRIGSERLGFLGTGKACSEYLGILAAPNHLELAIECLADWMMEAAQGLHGDENRWERLDLDSVSPNDDATNLLCEKLSSHGAAWLKQPAARCWRIDLSGGHESWLNGLHPSIRRKVRSLTLKAIQTGHANYKVAKTTAERLDVYENLVRLHSARRRQLGDEGCFATQGFYEFLKQIVSDPQAGKLVHLAQLEINARTVAAGLCLEGANSLFVYQSGILVPDGAGSDRLENNPGWLLNLYHIAHARSRNLRYIDFLRGDERYKQHLGAVSNHVDFHMLVPPTASALIRHQLWTWAQATKALGKELIAALPI
jgi:CelD/BcsL family acetyltransferase involved in cellulose biosynthesis